MSAADTAAQDMPADRLAPNEAEIVHPDGAPYLPALIDDRPAFLTRDTPLIDTIPARWVEYIGKTVAIAEDAKQHPITRGEIGMLIEVAARYQLDPFAKEIWLAKSKRGKLLMMVARDGLRKIAQRNGLHVDGDVVHEGDTFEVARTPDGQRTVTHSYSFAGDRGKILGAWAEVRAGGPMGKPMGFFYAALSEYKPAGASDWSVWGKQVSVMILGAAERTAIRQATPLGGLVAFGEHESAFARATLGEGTGNGEPSNVALGPAIEAVIARAQELGNAAIADRETVAMQVADAEGKVIAERAAAWLRSATAELDAIPAEAEVIDGEPVSGDVSRERPQAGVPPSEGENGREASSTPAQPVESAEAPDPDRIAALRRRGENLLSDAEDAKAAGNEEAADALFAEFEAVAAQVEAMGDENQSSLAI